MTGGEAHSQLSDHRLQIMLAQLLLRLWLRRVVDCEQVYHECITPQRLCSPSARPKNTAPRSGDYRLNYNVVAALIAEGEFVTALGDITMKDEDGKAEQYAYCDVWRFRGGKMVELRAFVIKTDAQDETSSAA